MRDSSQHLNVANSCGLKNLERVHYETAAILPLCSRIITTNSGSVTEYLGDGLLAFFHASEDKVKDACYKCHDAAVDCLESVKTIANPILLERYKLPSIEIGVGMAYSQSIVTVIGDGSNIKPIAFGKCVFDATKLSKGRNQVIVSESLKLIWPTGEKGRITFLPTRIKDHSGYVMHES
jgi:class 3 adenylate cyclase